MCSTAETLPACGNGFPSSPGGGPNPSRWSASTPVRATAARYDSSLATAAFPPTQRSRQTRPRIVRLANQALTRCRQRTQTDTTGHRGRKGDALYGIRQLLLTGAERLDDRGWERLWAAIDRGDPYDEVADCWDG